MRTGDNPAHCLPSGTLTKVAQRKGCGAKVRGFHSLGRQASITILAPAYNAGVFFDSGGKDDFLIKDRSTPFFFASTTCTNEFMN